MFRGHAPRIIKDEDASNRSASDSFETLLVTTYERDGSQYGKEQHETDTNDEESPILNAFRPRRDVFFRLDPVGGWERHRSCSPTLEQMRNQRHNGE
jgi:hypothetical protein